MVSNTVYFKQIKLRKKEGKVLITEKSVLEDAQGLIKELRKGTASLPKGQKYPLGFLEVLVHTTD